MTLKEIERIIMGQPPRTIFDKVAEKQDEDGSDNDTGDGDGSDGTPDQPEKYLHCHYNSEYIAEVEAPEPRDEQDDEGYTFC